MAFINTFARCGTRVALVALFCASSGFSEDLEAQDVGHASVALCSESVSFLGHDRFAANLRSVRVAATVESSVLFAKVRSLEQRCAKHLKLVPPTVVDKKTPAFSGDVHDYSSLAPYWWPDPEQPDGLPYVRRDGEIFDGYLSDEVSDAGRIREMMGAVSDLALLYGMTGEEPLAAKAVELLETWFVNPGTRMNPHMSYAQAVRGVSQGRCFGIIESARFTQIPLVLELLRGSSSLNDSIVDALKQWFDAYLDWLLSSDLGKEEGRRLNNHGTYYDVQVTTYALFVGRVELAKRVLNAVPSRRIVSQIEPDGRQPHELARTKSLSYSLMNLRAFLRLATLGEEMGIDLRHFRGPDGQGLRPAVDFLLPYASHPDHWPLPQMKPVHPADFVEVVLAAAVLFGDSGLTDQAIELWRLDSIDLEQVIWFYELLKKEL